MARIENHQYSIEEAFRECFYIVPDYQREYVWTDKEVHQLLEDIGEQIDAGTTRQYFIGTVLVSPTEQKNHYEVIDGQQRLRFLRGMRRLSRRATHCSSLWRRRSGRRRPSASDHDLDARPDRGSPHSPEQRLQHSQ